MYTKLTVTAITELLSILEAYSTGLSRSNLYSRSVDPREGIIEFSIYVSNCFSGSTLDLVGPFFSKAMLSDKYLGVIDNLSSVDLNFKTVSSSKAMLLVLHDVGPVVFLNLKSNKAVFASLLLELYKFRVSYVSSEPS